MTGLQTIDRQIADLLVGASLGERSGILKTSRGKLKRLFCFDAGRVVFAVSNVIEEQLEERLARDGVVSAEQLVAARRACAGQAKPRVTCWLVDEGGLAAESMDRALADHVRALLFDTLDWMDGEAEFAEGKPNLGGERTASLDATELLLDYARTRPESIDQARMRIGPPDARPSASENSDRLLAGRELDGTTRYVLARCDGSLALGGVVAEGPAAPEEIWRTIYGLVLAGILQTETARAATRVSTEADVSRKELLARLERARGATHYGVLEVGQTAEGEEIRSAYYFLARRYHPDRFRSGDLTDLLPGIEAYFTQVTEAYNTLYDAELRAEYDSQLAEAGGPKKAEQDTKELARQNYLRARALIERRSYTDAVTSLENAIKLDAGEARYHLELGRLLGRNPRKRSEAIERLVECNRIDPALVDGYMALGDLYLRMQKPEEAVPQFREVLRWEPGHIEATERLAKLGASDKDGGVFRGLFRG